MKLLLINTVVSFASTARVVKDIAREYEQKGYEVRIAYGRDMRTHATGDEYVHIGNDMDVYWHVLYTRLTDKHGLASRKATKEFLKWADEYDPDIVWLHNVHGYYINYEKLFEWIKKRPQMQVKWTLHDCWAFTGHCAYYTDLNCDKWQNGCHDCPQRGAYPGSFADNSKDNYLRKKRAFQGVPNMTIVTPSQWLADEVKKSFLSEYPVEVRYNSINRDVFKPSESSFRAEHGLEDKIMVLGVANIWEKRKGLDDFVKLGKMLDRRNEQISDGSREKRYQVVLVGLTQKQISALEKENANTLALPRTSGPQELAQIYSAADVFVNMTSEDNYPTVNLEAEACGTPVLSYDTGGCRETISRPDSFAGCHSVDDIYNRILRFNNKAIINNQT